MNDAASWMHSRRQSDSAGSSGGFKSPSEADDKPLTASSILPLASLLIRLNTEIF